MRLIDADALSNRILLTTHTEQSLFALNLLFGLVKDAPTIGGWISVKDRLPAAGQNVLVYMERDAWPDSGYCRKRDIEKGWQINGVWHCDGCSRVLGLFWMPLPELPEEVTEDA